jgi:predicted peptidase
VLLSFCSSSIYTQEIELPDSLFAQLVELHYSMNDTLDQHFYVEYPKGYNDSKSYPVFLGISGGNQSDDIIKYCYAAYFKTSLFNEYIKVLPVSPDPHGFLSISEKYYPDLVSLIKRKFPCTSSGWLIAGTSNGGIAALELVTVQPELFSGLIAYPGIIYGDKVNVTDSWNHITVLLAYGEEDSDGWQAGIFKTDSVFRSHSITVDTMMLIDQGHIIELDYDIDKVYRKYNKMILNK